MLAIILAVILALFPGKQEANVVVIPPMPTNPPMTPGDVAFVNEAEEWEAFHADAFAEYADEFTALFNAIEFKRAKNGASMVRRPGDKSFRFVKKG
jgi:hypothetical protein